MPITETFFAQNSAETLIIAVSAFVIIVVAGYIFDAWLDSKIKGNIIKADTYYVLGLQVAIYILVIPESIHKWIALILWIWLLSRMVSPIKEVCLFAFKKVFKATGSNAILKFIQNFIAWFIWIIGVLMILSNVGFNISSLLLGLGVGGVAIGFALKETVENLFGTISIYMEHLFDVGDYVVFGSNKGTVKDIGLLMTRITTYDGKEIMVHNSTFTKATLENWRTNKEPLVEITIPISRDTEKTKINKLINDIIAIIDADAGFRLRRVVFSEITNNAFNISASFFITDERNKIKVKSETSITITEILKKNKIKEPKILV